MSSQGWATPIDAPGDRQPQQIAAQVAVRELIEAYPDLPVTLDLNGGDVRKFPRNAMVARALADRVLGLAHVSRPGQHAVASSLTRVDASHASISNLAPIAAGGSERIILTATSSERAYVTARTPSPLNFLSLRETIAGTDLPRRLKPANINWHVDAATDRALLGILRQHLTEARASVLAPVLASDYADIAHGFFSTRIEAIGPRAWRVSERGKLQTVRLDRAQDLIVDVNASRGVLGYMHHGSALYVALDEAVEAAEVVVADGAANSPDGLIDSRWRVRNVVREPGRIELEALGYGRGEIAWRTAPFATFALSARRGSSTLWNGSAAADKLGRLAFTVPVDAIEPLTLQMTQTNR